MTEPIHATADSSVVTADVTNIRSYVASTAQGNISISARDANAKEIAVFNVTKVPVMNYWGGVMPAIVIEETGAAGATMHAESVSFYPDRDDLSRTEFELFGVGDQNVIIRSAYDGNDTLTRVSLFAYKMAGAPGQARLGKFLSGKLHSATPFDVPASYPSLEDYIDGWIDATGTSPVWESDELDNVYFTMRDPTWIGAVISALDPTIIDPTTVTTPQSRGGAGLHFTNTGGGSGSGGSGSGSGGKGSSSGGKGTGKPGAGSGAGKGAGAKTPKSGQTSGCDKGGIGGTLGNILGNVAKNPSGSLTGAKACKDCVSGLTGGGTSKTPTGSGSGTDAGTSSGTTDSGSGSATTDSGTKADGGVARPTKKKKSATKTQVVATAKTTKKPKKTATSSNSCSSCQKFLGSTGVTKAATCAIGKLTNGVLGKSKGGSATNSNNNSPADDMSDDCKDDGSDCAAAPDGDDCTMGDSDDSSCGSDPDQDTDDSGSFETGGVDDDGSGGEGDVDTDDFGDAFSD